MTRIRRTAVAVAAAALLTFTGAATAHSATAAPSGGMSPHAACAYYSGRALTVYGNHGSHVSQAQCLLANWRYLPWSGVDGDFGTQTLAAVKKFQGAHGLTVDGEVGAHTWAKLYA
ncbi:MULTISPECIES: peptidoglycan-binding protein [unclassified Streptomyces]|uniref:peptidoglycan-binding domain-containing protein n=1 Tax=unclassified Streptomyces TaxID=2593676 RepID=UPI0022576851|nr:peptidoglycan-binding domain-containing protein [Streptomyces sp. NBC_01306]MCX4729103.1 peptidoglycan-binding protein [Streptomyces sp. NBC_01306]WSX65740.1 peptidoglycan-binding protein [Streptomyces sp. NBC_00932]